MKIERAGSNRIRMAVDGDRLGDGHGAKIACVETIDIAVGCGLGERTLKRKAWR
jgi:hypothetical protein